MGVTAVKTRNRLPRYYLSTTFRRDC